MCVRRLRGASFGWPCALSAATVVAAVWTALPDHSHMPAALAPHRPLGVLALNVVGSALRAFGLGGAIGMLPSTSADGRAAVATMADVLIASACVDAALPKGASCDMQLDAELAGDLASDGERTGGNSWREGLEQLLASSRRDGHLTPLGELIVRGQVQLWLSGRARLLHAWRGLGARSLNRQSIARPVFIVGLPRTGSTFLHNLLAQDPRFRAPLHWELVEPILADGGAGGAESHIAARQADLVRYTSLVGGNAGVGGKSGALHAIHPIDALMPEECVTTFAHEFASLLFQATSDVDGYNRWLLRRRNHSRVMRWHHRVLQFLQHRGAEGDHGNSSAPRWLLKTPQFSMMLDDIMHEYPDATIIHTHRDPAESIGSSASLFARMHSAASDSIDMPRIGRQQVELAEALVGRAAESRAQMRDRGVLAVDVTLAALKRDPIGAVGNIYRALGLELTRDTQSRMASWLATREVRHGGHRFDLRDFGLDAGGVVASSPTLRAYCEAHGLEGPGCGVLPANCSDSGEVRQQAATAGCSAD